MTEQLVDFLGVACARIRGGVGKMGICLQVTTSEGSIVLTQAQASYLAGFLFGWVEKEKLIVDQQIDKVEKGKL